MIRAAKARKLPVTCGVSINHLTLNENDIGPYRTFFKMRPPLRSEDDRPAMVRGVADGDIDVIVSSHDPQDADDKRRPFAEAADGAVGLETLLPAALRLYHYGEIDAVDAAQGADHQPGEAPRPARSAASPRGPSPTSCWSISTRPGCEHGQPALALEEHALRRKQDAGRVLRTVAGQTVMSWLEAAQPS